MKSLSPMITLGAAGTGLKFRPEPYGRGGIEEFLRDVLAMANAGTDDQRYIVVGVDEDASGRRQLREVPEADFSGTPAYTRLVAEHIEPAVTLKYYSVSVEGTRVGVFEIEDCAEMPYMMRIDFSETLRRGDAYARVNTRSVKLGRRQLQSIFERYFQDSVSSEQVEIGFAGDHIAKTRGLQTFDISSRPSSVASGKLREFLDVRSNARRRGATSLVARLTHARLYGSDSPYEYRSPEELEAELARIEEEYADRDARYLFEEHGESVQMVIYNQGAESLRDVSLTVLLPAHDEFLVAEALPEDNSIEPTEYPAVSIVDDAIQIRTSLGDVPPGELVESFAQPLRVFAGLGLRGRKIGLQYLLSASNLRKPAKGKLKLML